MVQLCLRSRFLPCLLLVLWIQSGSCLFFFRSNNNEDNNKAVNTAPTAERLKDCQAHLKKVIKLTASLPVFIRLAWHDSGTFDKSLYAYWPRCGGAQGSVRFKVERDHDANKGLSIAVTILQKTKNRFPEISYADIYQMASVTAIEIAGGPKIPLKYGRMDADSSEDILPEGNLPSGGGPFPNGDATAAQHLRRVFYRMGLTDKDIVALSGAHTVGRAHPINSGFGKLFTKYTFLGPGIPGGSSWTPDWLRFDNEYYKFVKEKGTNQLVVLETDKALFEDDDFRPYAEKYLASKDVFFADYTTSHIKLSELGVRWAKGAPIFLPEE